MLKKKRCGFPLNDRETIFCQDWRVSKKHGRCWREEHQGSRKKKAIVSKKFIEKDAIHALTAQESGTGIIQPDDETIKKLDYALYMAEVKMPLHFFPIQSTTKVFTNLIPTLCMSPAGIMYINPGFFKDRPIEEAAALLLHEIMHKYQLHHKQAEDFNIEGEYNKIANIAMDCEINEAIRDWYDKDGIKLPEGGCYPERFDLESHETWDKYYLELIKNKDKLAKEEPQSGEGEEGDESSEQYSSQSNEGEENEDQSSSQDGEQSSQENEDGDNGEQSSQDGEGEESESGSGNSAQSQSSEEDDGQNEDKQGQQDSGQGGSGTPSDASSNKSGHGSNKKEPDKIGARENGCVESPDDQDIIDEIEKKVMEEGDRRRESGKMSPSPTLEKEIREGRANPEKKLEEERDAYRENLQDQVKAQGDSADEAERMLNDYFPPPKVDWTQAIRHSTDLTKKLNRRTLETYDSFNPQEAVMNKMGRQLHQRRNKKRGLATPYRSVKVPSLKSLSYAEVGICIDTSASMSTEDLTQIAAEIEEIVDVRDNDNLGVKIVPCDAEAGEMQVYQSVEELKLTGGGGTDMREGIKEMVRLREEEGVKMEQVIVMTDGYTQWPEHPPYGIREVMVLLVGENRADPSTIPDWMTVLEYDNKK